MKRLAILGSTGSIGRSALAVVDAHPLGCGSSALAAGDNASLLAEQVAAIARLWRPSATRRAWTACARRIGVDVATALRCWRRRG